MSARKKGKKSSDGGDGGGDAVAECESILKFLMAKPESEPYSAPVDWEFYGLTDYPEIIKKPMDLGTIKTKLDTGKYSGSGAADKFAADVRLVWTNAMTYNRPGSEIYTTADKLAKLFERKFQKLKKDGGASATGAGAAAPSSSSSTTRPPAAPAAAKPRRAEGAGRGTAPNEVTREDRVRFSNMVSQLSGDELGQLVDIIQKESPDALNEEDEKEIEIEINNIDAATLVMLNEFATKCIEKKSGGAGAGSSTTSAPTKKK